MPTCPTESTARLRIYRRIYLFDPSVAIDSVPATTNAFLGYARLGMPPYHAELTVKTRGKRSKKLFDRFVSGYLKPYDPSRFDRLVGAMSNYTLARDKILVTTKTADVARAGGYKAGSLKAGEIV